MSKEYTISAGGLTIAGATTLAFINPAAATGLEILRVVVGSTANANSVQQRIQLVTQVTAFPTLTSATPTANRISDAASAIVGGTAGAAGTCGVNASAEGAGAKTVRFGDIFNSGAGSWLWLPSERERIVLPGGSGAGFGVFLPVAPPALTNWTVTVVFGETG